ncbi:MAG: hypothetical protein AB7U82_33595 [Blastocatellales bacterium]
MAEEQTTVLYDADGKQLVRFTTIFDGDKYEVAHVFEPIDDETIIQYADDDDAEKNLELWKKFCAFTEGYVNQNGDQLSVEECLSLIPEADREFAIDSAILATRVIQPSTAPTGKKLMLNAEKRVTTHKLAAFFDSKEVITEHKLRREGNEERRIWRALQSNALPIKHGATRIISRSRALVLLYDMLHDGHSGYAGRVPAHHKMVIASIHMSLRQELLLGK